MVEQRIIQPGIVTLDVDGYGVAAVTVPSGVVWDVELISVSTTTVTTVGSSQPAATVFYGVKPNPVNYIEETFLGNGDSTDSRYKLLGGDSVCVEWRGGVAGAKATMCVRAMQREV